MKLDDPELVRREYTTEDGLEGRRSAYQYAEGVNAPETVFDAVAELAPRRVLEVGCGPGELAARIAAELGVELLALDISPRMVELARSRGVDARVGDLQELPFRDGEFDCVVAAWVLFHVPDLDRGVRELARILRPGGRLVAATNDVDHLQELRELFGQSPSREMAFDGRNSEELLLRHFSRVEARHAAGVVRFPDREAVQRYVDAAITLFGQVDLPPIDGPFPVRYHAVVFVAEK